jgi:hypothetical protein
MPDILPELLRQILRNFSYHELLTVYLVNTLWYETAKSELKLRVSKFLINPSRQASNQMTVDFPYRPQMYPANKSVRRRLQSAGRLKTDRYYMTSGMEHVEFRYEAKRAGSGNDSSSLAVVAERLGPAVDDPYSNLPSRPLPSATSFLLVLYDYLNPETTFRLFFDADTSPIDPASVVKHQEQRRLQISNVPFRLQAVECISHHSNIYFVLPQSLITAFTVDVKTVFNFEALPTERLLFRGLEVSLQFSLEGNTKIDEAGTIHGDPVGGSS